MVLAETKGRERTVERLIMKADEIVAQLKATQGTLTAVGGELDKVQAEITTLLALVKDLQNQVTNGDVPQSIVDAVQAVSDQASVVAQKAQAADDLVPDAPPPAP